VSPANQSGLDPVPPLPRGPGDAAKLYLTADEHYGHANIIKYQGRPFHVVKLMDKALIANHNAVVRDQDHVIHIGDFAMGDANGKCNELIAVLRQLKGFHHLMDGSHDRALSDYLALPHTPSDLARRVTVLPKLFEFKYGGERITLCHYAMARWWCSHRGAVHFFGHTHGDYAHPGRAIDVGVDVHGFFPVLIDRALSMGLARPVFENHPRK
jgi:calcineurin-like phosphoesterase family protein